MANDCPVTTCLPPGNCRPRIQRLQCCSAAVTAAPLKRRRFRQLQFLPSIAAVTNDPAVTRGTLWLEPTTACSAAVSALNNICSVMSESVALHCVVSVLQLHEVKTTEMARKPTLGFNHQSAGWPLATSQARQ